MFYKTNTVANNFTKNNGLILPSRIIRHFKQVLPKKPKTSKKKKKNTKTTKKTNNNNNTTLTPKKENEKETEEFTRSTSMISPTTMSASTSLLSASDNESIFDSKTNERPRSMMNLQFNINDIKNTKLNNDEINDDEYEKKNKLLTEEERRRTMLPLNTNTNKVITKSIKATFFDNHDTPTSEIDNAFEIDKLRNKYDEQTLEENEKKFHSKKAASFNNLQFNVSDEDEDDIIQRKEKIKKLKENKNIGFTKKINVNKQKTENKNDNETEKENTKEKRSSGISLTSSVTTPTNDKYIDHGIFALCFIICIYPRTLLCINIYS